MSGFVFIPTFVHVYLVLINKPFKIYHFSYALSITFLSLDKGFTNEICIITNKGVSPICLIFAI